MSYFYRDLHKVLKVIHSCETSVQLQVAKKMRELFFKKYPKTPKLEREYLFEAFVDSKIYKTSTPPKEP